jgi:hypothetical protein
MTTADQDEKDRSGPFEARYLAFLERSPIFAPACTVIALE